MKPVVSVTEAGPFHPQIAKLIYLVRGHRVLLDSDLANLYGVETGALVRAMHRNAERFPEDFVLQLSEEEVLRCQIGISRGRHGGRRYLPYAFTEEGVAMLSSVLRSKRAGVVNVQIMRAFVTMRQLLRENAELSQRLDELEERYDATFKEVFDAIRRLMSTDEVPRKRIGFHTKP